MIGCCHRSSPGAGSGPAVGLDAGDVCVGLVGHGQLTTLFALLNRLAGGGDILQMGQSGTGGLNERLPAYVDRARTAATQPGRVLCPFDFGP
jgi:hypothetical protein